MDDTSGPERSGPERKTRRPHRKSRNGCSKCKDRRIKCDELTPRCSRCTKMNLVCLYPKRKPDFLAPEGRWAEGTTSPGSPGHSCSSAIATSPLSSGFGSSPLSLHSSLRSQVAQTLSPAAFDLFKHYLEHTSRDLTVDEDDQYTLQIGIPNLACESKPLMRSLLAFSAVCKCRDMIDQNPDRARVEEMLSLAEKYHLESLRETQAALHESTCYDSVLANAAMMGMYGSGSYVIRIWLARMQDPPGDDTIPKYPQWISLYRAVDLAYAALLTEDPTPPKYRISPRVEMPAAAPTHPLSPIFAATFDSALARLRERAVLLFPADASCLAALALLETVATDTFRPSHNHKDPLLEIVDVEHPRLAGVAPWLRRYAASITSTVPSRLPRRVIVAFAHRVPAPYLYLVESAMLRLLSGTATVDSGLDVHEEMGLRLEKEMDATHQLALDIFAHWLVLVMLLDEVWWIGGIGAWELEKIVAAARGAGLWREEDWWPESMWEVGRQFKKHREGRRDCSVW